MAGQFGTWIVEILHYAQSERGYVRVTPKSVPHKAARQTALEYVGGDAIGIRIRCIATGSFEQIKGPS